MATTATFTVDSSYNLNVSIQVQGTANNINWGDGSPLDNVSNGTISHTYGSSNIFTVTFDDDGITQLTLSTNNNITSLDVSGLTSLQTLSCYNNQLTSLDVSSLRDLQYLYCFSNQLPSLDVSGSRDLLYLNCNDNQLPSLDVSGLTSLQTLYCYNNQLTSLDVSSCTSLGTLNCYSNQLPSLDVSSCTSLQSLDINKNKLTNIPIQTILTTIISFNYYGGYLNLKNQKTFELPTLNIINDVNTLVNTYSWIVLINLYPKKGIPGTIDMGFDYGLGFNNDVTCFGLQTDKKLLVGGSFDYYNNENTPSGIIRLNTNGSWDVNFNYLGSGIGVGQNSILSLAVNPDDSVIIGGDFDSYNGTSVDKLIKLLPSGYIDYDFQFGNLIDGKNVNKVLIQSDGKILVGGNFDNYSGLTTNNFMRLNSDGTLDESYDYSYCFDSEVRDILIQPNGKILVGGNFTSYSGVPTYYLIRLNTDLTIDETFDYGVYLNSVVYTIGLQSDGKILIGGEFTNYNGTFVGNIAMLNTNGTLDTSFNNGGSGFNTDVKKIVVQNNGKIVVGGGFQSYNDEVNNSIIRLNPNGSKDNTFITESGFNNSVLTLLSTDKNEIYVGGQFTEYNI